MPSICATTSTKYVQQLESKLKWAYYVAQEVSEKESRRHNHNYDQRFRGVKLAPRHLVLVKGQAFKGKHMIQDHWESQVYLVVEQCYDKSPVFKAKPHKCEGESKNFALQHVVTTNTGTHTT